MHMVKRHPDWIHAYIGIGQVVNSMDNERVLYERLLSNAREKKEDHLIDKLQAIAPYPDPECRVKSFLNNSMFVRKELSRLAGEAATHHITWDDIHRIVSFDRLISPYLTLTDISNALLGDKAAVFRDSRFTEDFFDIDLPKDIGSSFEVPIFFFTGAHDWHTPRLLSDKWFTQNNAPYKELIHFEESCHVVVNEEPGKVLTALVNKVLPFAQGGTGREVNET
jgi:pimeloyl-ACP methyl ester carboxylesterase